MTIHFIDAAIIVLYLVLVIGFGLWKSRKVKSSDDYLVAGRSLGLFVLVGTLVMTEFNTASFVGYTIFSYRAGLYACLIALCFLFGLGPYTLVVAKRWNRLKAISITEMIEQRFDRRLRLLTSLMIIATLLLFSTAYLKGASLVFSMALNLSLAQTVVAISAVVLIFTLAGGLVSVSWTNLVSFIVAIVVMPVLFFITVSKANALGGLSTVFEPRYLSFNVAGMWKDPVLPFEIILTVWVLLFLIYMQSPWYGQIMFATRNAKTAYAGMGIATVLVVALYALNFALGAYARVGFPNLDDPQNSIPKVIAEWMPVGIRGLTLALVFAVCQTTMATIWNNNVSIITQDVYRGFINPSATDKRVLTVSRVLTLMVALFTIVVSITLVDVVIKVMFVANIFMVSLFFPMIGGFLWWRIGKKAAWATAVLGIAAGWTVFLLKETANDRLPVFFQGHDWLFLYCCVLYPIIVAIGIVVSFLEKPSEDDTKKKIAFFKKVGAPWFGKKDFLEAADGGGTGK